MEIQTVKDIKPKAKVAVQGASGSGKTYTALLLAYGLTGAYEKIAIIETDYKAANHYSYFGSFNTLCISAPFTPEKFIDAIELCEHSSIEVIIIDSLSAEWAGAGGMQQRVKEEGESCMHWHSTLLNTIEKSECHIIATLQSSEHYSFSSIQGTKQVVKMGLNPTQKEDIHYHFHTVLSLDMYHKAWVLKDRTSFFEDHSGIVITEEIAALFARWCGSDRISLPIELKERICGCKSVKELLELMYQCDQDNASVQQAFAQRRLELERALDQNTIYSLHKPSQNGNHRNRA